MKKKIYSILILISLISVTSIHGMDIIKKGTDILTPESGKNTLLDFGVKGKEEKHLAKLKEEKKNLEEKTKVSSEKIEQQISQTANKINKLNVEIKEQPDNDFSINKLALLNETYQTLKDTQALKKQLALSLDDHIELLENYINDPEFKDFIKEYREQKRFFSFKDLQNLHEMILSQEKLFESLEEQLKNSQIELENREQTSITISEKYKKKKKEMETFIKNPDKGTTPDYMFAFNAEQKLDLLTLEENLFKIKEDLNKLKLKETEYKVDLISTKKFLANLKLDILKKAAKYIKSRIRIIEADIETDKANLEKKKRSSFINKEKARIEIESISRDYETKSKMINEFSKQFKIPINLELNKWAIEPTSEKDYTNYFKLAHANEYLSVLESQKELKEAQTAKEDEQLFQDKVQIGTKETLYKTIVKKFKSEDEINKEIKNYFASRAEIKAKTARYNEKNKAIEDKLGIKKKALENIKTLKNKIQKEKNTLFGPNQLSYRNCLNYLNNAEETIKKQIKNAQQTSNLYDSIVEINKNADKQVEFILSELETLGMWYRPEYAIKWQELKNILPETNRFIGDLKTYISQLSITNLVQKTKMAFPQPLDIIIFLIKLILLLVLLLLFRIYAPKIHKRLITISKENKGLRLINLFAAFILEFIIKNFLLISVWIISFATFQFDAIPDQYMQILFYLVSIPYLLYLANRFLSHFIEFNKKYDLIVLVKSFEKRFLLIFSILLYATIIIQCFRKAFILGIYYKSELPSILSALNVIILQISLISLISKEQILNIISTRTKTWRWIHSIVNRFYYIILFVVGTIIVLSNPYIGFSKLVLYLAPRFLFTGILIALLFILHGLIKKISLKLFFETEEEIVRARFNYGKTMYGLYVIVTFILLIAIGFLIGAQIWGWKITPTAISEWLTKQYFIEGKAISIMSFIKLILHIGIGFLISFLINKFVLRRIFDLLLVDSGVQYAVSSILSYLIVTIFVITGFHIIGFGNLITWLIGALVLSIGWVAKDPLADFIYYFLILIQRPLKIGDFIQIDEEITGVVRKITPRSTIIRKKNSETILVPNSQILTKPIINWNYVPGFIAFDDIMIQIAYKEDPVKTKKVLFDVLDQHPNVLKSPKPIIRLENFEKYGYEFLIRGFLSSHYTLDKWDIAGDIRLALVKALRENNIEIAVPIRISISQQQQIEKSVTTKETDQKIEKTNKEDRKDD